MKPCPFNNKDCNEECPLWIKVKMEVLGEKYRDTVDGGICSFKMMGMTSSPFNIYDVFKWNGIIRKEVSND